MTVCPQWLFFTKSSQIPGSPVIKLGLPPWTQCHKKHRVRLCWGCFSRDSFAAVRDEEYFSICSWTSTPTFCLLYKHRCKLVFEWLRYYWAVTCYMQPIYFILMINSLLCCNSQFNLLPPFLNQAAKTDQWQRWWLWNCCTGVPLTEGLTRYQLRRKLNCMGDQKRTDVDRESVRWYVWECVLAWDYREPVSLAHTKWQKWIHELVWNSMLTKGTHRSASVPSQLLPKRTGFCKLSSCKLYEERKMKVSCLQEGKEEEGGTSRGNNIQVELEKKWNGKKDTSHWHGVLPGMMELNWELKKHWRHMTTLPCAVKLPTVRVSIQDLYGALLYFTVCLYSQLYWHRWEYLWSSEVPLNMKTGAIKMAYTQTHTIVAQIHLKPHYS